MKHNPVKSWFDNTIKEEFDELPIGSNPKFIKKLKEKLGEKRINEILKQLKKSSTFKS